MDSESGNSADGAGRPVVLRMALAEYDTAWHDPATSLARAQAMIREATACEARVVILPEMATTGFTMDAGQSVGLDAEPVEALRRLASENGTWLVAGVALNEATGGTGRSAVVNAALAIDPSGEIVGVHRKQRLFAFAGEHETYTAGAATTIVPMDGVRIGIFICYELRFPELFAAVAPQCDAMVVIANWPAARRPHWDALLRARAIENQCVVVGVNRVGTADGIAYDGGSEAFDAWGDPLPRVDCAAPVVDVDPAAVAAIRSRYPFLADRAATR